MFAREYVKTGQACEAYRRAFPTCKSSLAAKANGWRLLHPHSDYVYASKAVNKRINELRAIMAKKSDITMDKVLTDYQYALELAKQKDEANNIINAATSQAKLVGLIVDRKENGNAGDFAHLDTVSEILNALNDQVGPEITLAVTKAMGLIQEDNPELDKRVEEVEALLEAKSPSDQVN